MDEDVPASEAYEHSELLLYKARILEEGMRLVLLPAVAAVCNWPHAWKDPIIDRCIW